MYGFYTHGWTLYGSVTLAAMGGLLYRSGMTRPAAEHRRIYGSPERQEFVRKLGCLICGAPPELAHTQSGGMGRKADARTIVPLCPPHHSEQHQYGTKTFEASYGLDLKASAAWIEARWQEEASRQG